MSRNQEADDIQELFDHNREWAAQMEQDDPGFFARLSKQQKPEFLWIGCSDSRVSANQITGLMPGEARLCELNVLQQVRSLCRTTVMKEAWDRGQAIDVHGWIYGVEDGLLRVLGDRITSSACT